MKRTNLLALLVFGFLFVSVPACSKDNSRNAGGSSYAAGKTALSVLDTESADYASNYQIIITKSGDYIFLPSVQTEITKGFIFYPGGKVKCEAYLPIVSELAKKGYLTVLVHMPMDLAIFNKSGADSFLKQFPQIKHWYIGGHSLGGAMAGDYLSKKSDKFDGLVLLAAYSQKKISQNLKVLSIYGSCDQILNKNNYEKYKKNLPADFHEEIIQGGIHSYFGDYGLQAGDGTPKITPETQLETTVSLISQFIETN